MKHITYHNYIEDQKDIPELYPFPSRPGVMINPQWLELPMSRTNLHSPKDVQVIKVHCQLLFVYGLNYDCDRCKTGNCGECHKSTP